MRDEQTFAEARNDPSVNPVERSLIDDEAMNNRCSFPRTSQVMDTLLLETVPASATAVFYTIDDGFSNWPMMPDRVETARSETIRSA